MRNMRQHLLMSALMLSGLMPMSSGPDPEPVLDLAHRNRPISPPYSPPKREPPPLKVRFVSYEPALEAVDFAKWLWPVRFIDWLIVGGESGTGARHKATQADRERSRKISSFICEREGDPRNGNQDRPCWKSRVERLDDGTLDRVWPSPNGDDEGNGCPDSWCTPCQDRQKLYVDKSVRKELGNAKRSFWAATRALLKACEV